MSAWRGRNFPLTPSRSYKAAGYDVIGMTAMPEAKLAREAEISYATVAMVTDFDCWHPEHDHVDVASVIEIVHNNTARASRLLARAAQGFSGRARALPHRLRPCARQRDPHRADARDPALLQKLDAVMSRHLAASGAGQSITTGR